MKLSPLVPLLWATYAIGVGLAVGGSQDARQHRDLGLYPRLINESFSVQSQTTSSATSVTSSTNLATTDAVVIPNGASNTDSRSVSLGFSTSGGETIVVASIVNSESTGPASISGASIVSGTNWATTTTSFTSSSTTSAMSEGPESPSSTTFTEASTSQQSSSDSKSTSISINIEPTTTTSFVVITSPFGTFLTTSTTVSTQVDSTTLIETSTTEQTTVQTSYSSPPSSTPNTQSDLSTTFAEPPQQATTTIVSSVISTASLVSTLVETTTSTGDAVVIFSSPIQTQSTTIFTEPNNGASTTTVVDATATISIPGAGEGPASATVSVTSTTLDLISVTQTETQQASISSPLPPIIIGTTVTLPSPSSTPSILQTTGLYTYVGCFTEGNGARALQGAFYPNDSNTITLCTAECYPFQFAGAEYGRECWCGDSFQGGSTQVADNDCTMSCAGDAREICGGSDRLSVYAWNGNSTTGESSSTQSAAPTSEPLTIGPSSSQTQIVPSTVEVSTSMASIFITISPSSMSSSTALSVFITSPPSSQQTTASTAIETTDTNTVPGSVTQSVWESTSTYDCQAVTVTVTEIQTLGHNSSWVTPNGGSSKGPSTSASSQTLMTWSTISSVFNSSNPMTWANTVVTINEGSTTATLQGTSNSSTSHFPPFQTTSGTSTSQRGFELASFLGFITLVLLV